MDKSLWGKRIADKIHAGEKNIDTAIKSLMEVVAEVQSAEADMHVSAVATDPSLAKLTEALALLQQSRTCTVAGHRRLDKLAKDLGIRVTGVGFGKHTYFAEEQVTGEAEQRAAI